jgi:hypothetical protein
VFFGRAGDRQPGAESQPDAPGHLSARCVRETASAAVSRSLFPCFRMGTAKEEKMKLNMFFLLFDVMILLAYPFIFIAWKARKYLSFKR